MDNMDCKTFRILYHKHGQMPLEKKIWDTPEHEERQNHSFTCKDCEEWIMKQEVAENNDESNNHPCIHLAYHAQHACKKHIDAFECHDTTLIKIRKEYGIPVRDGGSSFIKINNCPWCGIKINEN